MNARGAGVLGLGLLAAVACTEQVDLSYRPCPCSQGYVCCDQGGYSRCLADYADGTCDSTTAPAQSNGPDLQGGSSIATDQSPQCLAQDADHVYWINDDGRLFGAPKNGGGPIGSRWIPPPGPPISSLPTAGCSLVIDGDYAYATLPSLGRIARISLVTNGAWDIGNEGLLFGNLSLPSSLALDADAVYVTQFDTGLITRIPRPPVSAADGGAPDAGSVDGGAAPSFDQRTASRPSEIVAGTDTLFWFDETGLRTMPKTGGTLATLAANHQGAFLGLAAGALYWREASSEPPWALSVSGGDAVQVAWSALADYRNVFGSEDNALIDEKARAADQVGCSAGGTTIPTSDTDAGLTRESPLAVADHELVFSTDTVFHRVTIPGGAVADMFTYRGECSVSSRARLIVFDADSVFWTDDTTVWRHSRN